MRKLARTVHVPNPDTGLRQQFLAGTIPPKWAQKKITNPSAWESAKAATASAGDSDDAGEDATDASGTSAGGVTERPPTSGKGSGRDDWAAYAAHVGVAIDEAMSRDDIVDAIDAQAATASAGEGGDA